MIKIILLFLYMKRVFSYISNHILQSVQPSKIRKDINLQINNNFKALSYEKAKNIMNT